MGALRPSDTEFGHSLPPEARHTITTHLPSWANLMKWADGDGSFVPLITTPYPRIIPHPDVRELTSKVLEAFGLSKDQDCMLFPRPEFAAACKAYGTDKARGEDRLADAEITIRMFESSELLYAVFFPAAKGAGILPYRLMTGTGISSRFAEKCLAQANSPQAVQKPEAADSTLSAAHVQIQERIAGLLERAPVGPPRTKQVYKDDVFLYPSGMAAIYGLHSSLCEQDAGHTAIIGFPFHSTLDLFNAIGSGCSFFGRGDEQDLTKFAAELRRRKDQNDCQIDTVWTEFPANPLLTSADLKTLRKLADEYGFILIVDDTVGSSANVDALGAADVLITSLTKSFSGYADVMAGSVTLNPSSVQYQRLKKLMARSYINHFFQGDAEALERNSRDFLKRSKILNENGEYLAEFLQTYVKKPTSPVVQVFYPTINPDRKMCEAFMRSETPDFTPGYGGLLSVEFESIEAAIAFYDTLDVYKGPHFGAHLTIAMAYTQALYFKQAEWAAERNMRGKQVRIGVGLEDKEALKERIRLALEAVDAKKAP